MKLSMKAVRVNNNLTQAQAADKLGVSLPTLISIENGYNIPRIDYVMKFCKEMGVEIGDIKFFEQKQIKKGAK